MSTGSVIQFKFSASKTYESIEFNGLMIKLLELKRAIVEKRGLMKGMDFDLAVSNAQTKENYTDDDMMIPKNTSVVVRRVPASGGQPGLLARLDGTASGTKKAASAARPIEVPAREAPTDPRRRPRAVDEPAPVEDDGTAAVLANVMGAVDEFRPKGANRGPGGAGGRFGGMAGPQGGGGPLPPRPMGGRGGGGSAGQLPSSYVCHRCGKPGHFIRDCPEPANGENKFRQHSGVAGVPRAFWKPANDAKDGEEMKFDGIQPSSARFESLVKRGVGSAPDDPQRVREAASADNPPSHLVCPVCSKLFQDAVVLPCCGDAACDECARNALMTRNNSCPLCNQYCALDQLIPNKRLRTAVEKYQIEWLEKDRKRRTDQAALENAAVAGTSHTNTLEITNAAPDAVLDLGGGPPPTSSQRNQSMGGEDDFGGDVFAAPPVPKPEEEDETTPADDMKAAMVLAGHASDIPPNMLPPPQHSMGLGGPVHPSFGNAGGPVGAGYPQQQQPPPPQHQGYYDYRALSGHPVPPAAYGGGPPAASQWAGDPRNVGPRMPYPPRPPAWQQQPQQQQFPPQQQQQYPPNRNDRYDQPRRQDWREEDRRRGPPEEEEDVLDRMVTYDEFVDIWRRHRAEEAPATRRAGSRREDEPYTRRSRRDDDGRRSRRDEDESPPPYRRRHGRRDDDDDDEYEVISKKSRGDDNGFPSRRRARRDDDDDERPPRKRRNPPPRASRRIGDDNDDGEDRFHRRGRQQRERSQDEDMGDTVEIRIGCHKPSPPRDDDDRAAPVSDDQRAEVSNNED